MTCFELNEAYILLIVQFTSMYKLVKLKKSCLIMQNVLSRKLNNLHFSSSKSAAHKINDNLNFAG